jgi:hypothetical protein
MKIIIKLERAVFALSLGPADLRAIVLAVTLAFPSSHSALAELKRALVEQVSTWSPPLGGHENRAVDRPSEVGKVR